MVHSSIGVVPGMSILESGRVFYCLILAVGGCVAGIVFRVRFVDIDCACLTLSFFLLAFVLAFVAQAFVLYTERLHNFHAYVCIAFSVELPGFKRFWIVFLSASLMFCSYVTNFCRICLGVMQVGVVDSRVRLFCSVRVFVYLLVWLARFWFIGVLSVARFGCLVWVCFSYLVCL